MTNFEVAKERNIYFQREDKLNCIKRADVEGNVSEKYCIITTYKIAFTDV